jgi:hypothetical protein
MAATAEAGSTGVVVWSNARALRRSVRPTAWIVFEDVAHDAVLVGGHLVAHTSARLVAGHLGLDPGTAASALRTLRQRGLVELSQAPGPDGRFGLAAYTLRLPAGVEVLLPRENRPHAAGRTRST